MAHFAAVHMEPHMTATNPYATENPFDDLLPEIQMQIRQALVAARLGHIELSSKPTKPAIEPVAIPIDPQAHLRMLKAKSLANTYGKRTD